MVAAASTAVFDLDFDFDLFDLDFTLGEFTVGVLGELRVGKSFANATIAITVATTVIELLYMY